MSARQWRSRIWAAAALMCVAYYFGRTLPVRRTTQLGVETRLMRVPPQTRLLENPSGGRWIVTTTGEIGSSHDRFRPGAPRRPTSVPYSDEGTWELNGDTLRQVWQLPAKWLGDEHLIAGAPYVGYEDSVVLDLMTTRAYVGQPADALKRKYREPPEEGESSEDSPPKPSGLEDLPDTDYVYPQMTQAAGEVLTLWTAVPAHGARWLYASTNDDLPRSMPLVRGDQALTLSHDGRTLFFLRDQVLWRLDLRQPLPELLDKIPIPDFNIPE